MRVAGKRLGRRGSQTREAKEGGDTRDKVGVGGRRQDKGESRSTME